MSADKVVDDEGVKMETLPLKKRMKVSLEETVHPLVALNPDAKGLIVTTKRERKKLEP